MVTRKKHSSAFKAQVALAALKEDLTVSQICSKYKISASQVSKWKKTLLENSSNIFDGSKGVVSRSEDDNSEILYAKIGRLEIERDFLKKNLKKIGLE